MNHLKVKRKILSIYFMFSLITAGFIGLMVFEGVVDEGGVEAATTRYVGGTGPGNYSKIQDAIDNSSAGDTVKVLPGTYNENISINKKLNVIGSGSSLTTIDGGTKTTVQIAADGVKFAKFKVKRTNSGMGIYVRSSKNVIISYNHCPANSYIYTIYGSNILIKNNVVDRSPASMGIGIDVRFTLSNKVENNTVTNCSYSGIWLRNCSNSKVVNNTMKDCGWGIMFDLGSNYNVFEYNKGTRNGKDLAMLGGDYNIPRFNKFNIIYIGGCRYITAYNNTMTSGGFQVAGNKEYLLTHNITTSNTANGRPIYYWKSEKNKNVPAGVGQVILIDCSKVTISGQNCSNTYNSVNARYSDNLTIKNNIFSNNKESGITLYYTNSNLIKNNTMISNVGSGISLFACDHNTISENTCIKNGYNGIYVYYSSSNNLIYSNKVKQCKNGITISYNSHKNKIINNSFELNYDNGLSTYDSKYNTIEFNNITNNGNGTFVDTESEYTILRFNEISYSKDTGISISGSTKEVYHNNIISNFDQLKTFWDNNKWHKNGEGNYWSDYTGQDNGANGRITGDGVGDTNIPHLNVDNYPLIRANGWEYPGTPQLSVPKQIDHDGDYQIEWNYSNKAINYILEEDVEPNFKSPTQLYLGSGFSFFVNDRKNGTYYYRAKALGLYYESFWSTVKKVTVNWLPEPPVKLKAEVYPQGNALCLSWASGSIDTVGYKLYVNSTGAWELLDTINYTTTYNHSGLIDGKNYRYKLKAFDELDQVSEFSYELVAVPKDSIAPNPPKNILASAESDTLIHLSWASDLEPDLEGYQIFMKADISEKNDDFQFIKKVSKKYSSTEISGLIPNTKYTFKIQAYDEVPNYSLFSNLAYVRTPEYDVTPPVKPTGLTVSKPTENSLVLNWTSNPDDDVVGYFIFRSKITPKSFEKLNSDPLNATQYIDTGLNDVTVYYYFIRAIDDVGLESLDSDLASGKTLLGPRKPEINNTINNLIKYEDTVDNSSINLYYLFKDANNDVLEFSSLDQNNIKVIINQVTGDVVIVPNPDWSGEETITFYAKDYTGSIFYNITITIIPVNDPPYGVKILSPADNLQLTEGESVIMEGACQDMDMEYGEVLTYKWESSINGIIDKGKKIVTKELKPGVHLITLKVSDRNGESANAYVNITVLEKPNTQQADPKSGLVVGIVVIVIIMVIILLLFLILKRKKKAEVEQEPQQSAEIKDEKQKVLSQQPQQRTNQLFPTQVQEQTISQPQPLQNYCTYCGQQKTLIQQNNRLYCFQCHRYM